MTATRMNAVAAAVASLFCGVAAAAVSYEEDIPAFRPGVDSYNVKHGARGEWSDGRFVVSVPEGRGFIMDYSRYPGMKPFRGADEIVLVADTNGLGKATAALTLGEFPSGDKKTKTFYADLAGETRFRTKLNPAKRYQIKMIGIRREEKECAPWKIRFASLRGVFNTPNAEALRVEAETGNPLHIVREGRNEKPVLIVRNAAQDRIAAHGVLKMKGFYGDSFDLPVGVSLDGGQAAEIPVADGVKKGVWKIGGELTADDGSVAKVDTRFAVMDCHGKTPKQPRGTFRLGVHWHIQRYSDEDRRLTAAAMVACGAKLMRADIANMASIQGGGPDSWDFARSDALMETIEANGLSVDAIIFRTPKWAAMPENLTNSNWRAWSLGRPVPGTFERLCTGLARHYGTRIDYYEIGNEWDLPSFFPGTREEAVAILREGYRGVKRGNPDCCVIPCGWAAPYVGHGNVGMHEAILRNCSDCFDVHAIHRHGPFPKYVESIHRFFELRKRMGVSGKPWFSNETALTSVWSERDAALTVWKKILWAWANGSVDYIWYNLKGSGWDPKDPEQGYGLITADFRPRDTYVAFSALATVVGGAKFRRKVFDGDGRYWFEFEKEGAMVLTPWIDANGLDVSVRTDADSAVRVDVMGNRSRLPVANGKVSFRVSREPCAIVLGHATFADADEPSVRALKPAEPATVVIPPDSPGRKPDFVLDRPEQVHDFFEGNPAEVKRLWSGPKDNSAKVWLAKDVRGLRIRVEVEDDRHWQPYCGAEQYKGDDVQVELAAPGRRGRWEFGFAHRDGGSTEVHCWAVPDGYDAAEAAAWVELSTGREGTVTRYDALIPYAEAEGYTEKMLEDGILFSMMVNDNDGDGRDATIEIAPNTFHSREMSAAPVVRFAK